MFDNAVPITLNNLTNGTYTVYVIGKNSAGFWQDTNSATVSRTWTVSSVVDTDSDGIPDEWEIAFNLDENDADDAVEDADTDGMNNLQEFLAGTNPTNSLSRLTISIERPIAAGFPLQFEAQSNKSYTVQYRTSFSTGSWLRLQDLAPAPTNRSVALTNSTLDPAQFFRVVTPQQP
jgi:hypothetical protein